MFDLYQFTETRWRGSSPNVCIGRLSEICALIDRDEMATMFGGYIVYEAGQGDEYVGVWGGRNASRMRRILRERGATLNLLPGLSSDLRMKIRYVCYDMAEISLKPA
jgi:hypothetical protein